MSINLGITDYLLIALLLMVVMCFPFFKKVVALLEIVAKKYLQTPPPPVVNDEKNRLMNLKLLAYERMIMFIERMKPDSLVPRTLLSSMTNREYQQLLIAEIRREYEYNLSQQLYVSSEAWIAITNYKNNLLTLINSVATDLEGGKPATELAQKILEKYIYADLKTDEIILLMKANLEM
ncbi:MAG: hypothetical protein LBM07_03325 [Culturomica sp.]|jgi:hypothetical protein|nr:hypothetical protein [Culturomica sp.]